MPAAGPSCSLICGGGRPPLPTSGPWRPGWPPRSGWARRPTWCSCRGATSATLLCAASLSRSTGTSRVSTSPTATSCPAWGTGRTWGPLVGDPSRERTPRRPANLPTEVHGAPGLQQRHLAHLLRLLSDVEEGGVLRHGWAPDAHRLLA